MEGYTKTGSPLGKVLAPLGNYSHAIQLSDLLSFRLAGNGPRWEVNLKEEGPGLVGLRFTPLFNQATCEGDTRKPNPVVRPTQLLTKAGSKSSRNA